MNKFAIITGASRGIGKTVAHYFVTQGYDVALLARNAELLQKVKQEFLTVNSKVSIETYALDVADMPATYQLITDILNKHANVDVLINNAGIADLGTTDMTLEDFAKIQAVNVNGMFAVAKAVAEKMRAQQSGYIFNVASMSGKRATAKLGAYCASKHAVVGFTESLLRELMPYGIKVTSICPGLVDTDMTKNAKIANADKIQSEDIVKIIDSLLSLSAAAIVKTVNIECKSYIENYEIPDL